MEFVDPMLVAVYLCDKGGPRCKRMGLCIHKLDVNSVKVVSIEVRFALICRPDNIRK